MYILVPDITWQLFVTFFGLVSYYVTFWKGIPVSPPTFGDFPGHGLNHQVREFWSPSTIQVH